MGGTLQDMPCSVDPKAGSGILSSHPCPSAWQSLPWGFEVHNGSLGTTGLGGDESRDGGMGCEGLGWPWLGGGCWKGQK